MIKRIVVGVILLGLVSAATAAESVAFVNLEQIFEGFYKTKLSKAQVEVQKKDLESEQRVRVAEMTLISEEVEVLKKEARDTALSQEVRDQKRILYEERLLELRTMNKAIEEFKEQRQKQLQLQVARVSKTLMEEIRLAVIDFATSEGLMAVVDSSSRGATIGVFIYTHPSVDITERVLNKLNSTRPSGGGGELLMGDSQLGDPEAVKVKTETAE